MFQENAKYGAQLQFFDIQQFNDGRSLKWIAWFFAPLKNISELEGT